MRLFQLINHHIKKPRIRLRRARDMFVVGAVSAGLLLANIAPAVAAQNTTATAKVSFTFDDGFQSAITRAAPTLAKYGFSGTSYVTTGCVGMTTTPNSCRADTDIPYMTWEQVIQLRNSYGWEIGSHTVNHPLLASTDPEDQPVALTPAQVDQELSQSKAALAARGINATAFASPYGDWTPAVAAQIAKHYSSHRGFADIGFNTFPYNDYLLYDQQVQAGGDGVPSASVATVKRYIDQAAANKTWLVLTFHDIVESGAADYAYSAGDLDQIAAYVKSKNIPVVNVTQGLATNNSNLMPNTTFDNGVGEGWATDDPVKIKKDSAGNGSYPSAANSIAMEASSANRHLFSPRLAVTADQTYLIKLFLNVQNRSSGEVAFYIDEYDAGGNYITTQYKKSESSRFVEKINFEYRPSSVAVGKARLQVVVTANSGIKAYVDNVEWLASTNSTTPPQETFDNQILVRPDGRAYYVVNGQSHYIGHPAVRDCIMVRKSTGAWIRVADVEIDNHFSAGVGAHCNYEQEPGLNFVREENDPTVWLVRANGTKQHVGQLCVIDAYTTVHKKFRVWVVPKGETSGHVQGADFFGNPQACAQLPG